MRVFHQNDLSMDQVQSLTSIALSGLGTVRHDLRNYLSTCRLVSDNLIRAVEPITRSGWTPDICDRINALIRQLDSSLEAAAGRLDSVDFTFDSKYLGSNQFFGSPRHVVKSLMELATERNVKLTASSADTYLVYPQCALYATMGELITNALTHTLRPNAPTTVDVSWKFVDDRFVCSVSDDGPGILTRLGDNVGISDVTMLTEYGISTQSSGLSLVHRILRRSEGSLYFQRSVLGGTEVSFNFPIIGTWDPSAVPKGMWED